MTTGRGKEMESCTSNNSILCPKQDDGIHKQVSIRNATVLSKVSLEDDFIYFV